MSRQQQHPQQPPKPSPSSPFHIIRDEHEDVFFDDDQTFGLDGANEPMDPRTWKTFPSDDKVFAKNAPLKAALEALVKASYSGSSEAGQSAATTDAAAADSKAVIIAASGANK